MVTLSAPLTARRTPTSTSSEHSPPSITRSVLRLIEIVRESVCHRQFHCIEIVFTPRQSIHIQRKVFCAFIGVSGGDGDERRTSIPHEWTHLTQIYGIIIVFVRNTNGQEESPLVHHCLNSNEEAFTALIWSSLACMKVHFTAIFPARNRDREVWRKQKKNDLK